MLLNEFSLKVVTTEKKVILTTLSTGSRSTSSCFEKEKLKNKHALQWIQVK